MVWSWIPQNIGQIGQLTLQNAYLGVVSALLGLAISVPVGIVCARWRLLYPPVLSIASAIYAIPSLALFVVLIAYTGLSDATVIIPLTLFSLCVLVPNVVDGLRSVPEPVRQAATAMGFGPLRRLVAGRTAGRDPGHHRRAAGGDRLQHQPRQPRPADRRQQPGLLLHRRAPARLPDRDLSSASPW